jgi:heat shock protein HtpX
MYSQIAANKRRTLYILVGFFIFVAIIIFILVKFFNGGTGIFIGAMVGSLIYASITYFAGSRMSLALNRAKEVSREQNPRLYRIVENLAIEDGLPTPKIYIMNDPSPNAFATGRNPQHASVCVTSGLLDIMNDQELEAVLAHELSHIKNYDMRVNMIAFALTSIISLLADFMINIAFFGGMGGYGNGRRGGGGMDGEGQTTFLFLGLIAAILAPIIASLIQLAISRRREYLADASGALTTRYPEGLISALNKIDKTGSGLQNVNTATAHFFFANPLKGHKITNLFSTHPPIKDRIKKLQEMETSV